MKVESSNHSYVFTAEEIIDQLLVGYEEDERFPASLPPSYEQAAKDGWEIILHPIGDGTYRLKISRKA